MRTDWLVLRTRLVLAFRLHSFDQRLRIRVHRFRFGVLHAPDSISYMGRHNEHAGINPEFLESKNQKINSGMKPRTIKSEGVTMMNERIHKPLCCRHSEC